ncbi:MAG: hypothetical protein ACR2OH_05630 [Microthrixaceae bacterium]
MAFGDAVVPELKGVAKAIYSGGRFLAVAEGTAVFALDNVPTVDRAEKYRQSVEELLAKSLGTVVPIRLVTDADADSYASDSATASTPADVARRARGDGQGSADRSEVDRSEQATGVRESHAPSDRAASDRATPDRAAPDRARSRRESSNGDAAAKATGAERDREPTNQPAEADSTQAGESEDEAELVARVDELENADVSTRGVDKLTEAFPGAELLENEEKQ